MTTPPKWECTKCGCCCLGPWVKDALPEFYVDGKCRHLRNDMTCGIYENRPGVCRSKPGNDEIKIQVCKSVRRIVYERNNKVVN